MTTPPRTYRSRVVRAALGLVVAAALWAGFELGMRARYGAPPPSEFVALAGACTLDAARLDCVGQEQDLTLPPKGDRPRVVVFGGSTVRNPFDPDPLADFPAALAAALPDVEVLNLGVAGLTTAGVAALVASSRALQPDLVVLSTGHNDYSQHLFRGEIRARGLWMLPLLRVAQRSWVHGLLEGRIRGQERRTSDRLLATDDDTALRVRAEVDARFAGNLTIALRQSPAPVVVATLLRNFDAGPQGELTRGKPACPGALSRLPRTSGPGGAWRPWLREAETACGDGALAAWYRAHLSTDPAEARRQFSRSTELDPLPLRAPLPTDRLTREVAAREGATLVDVNEALGVLCPGAWFTDSLHLSREGARRYAAALEPAIRASLSER